MASTGDSPSPRRGWARVAWILVPALVFVGILTAVTLKRSGTPGPGDPAPGFTAPLVSGSGSLDLRSLEGKPVVLNFWASWCGPCKDEAPLLRDAHRRYGDRVAFVGVDVRDSKTDARRFMAENGMDYPSVFDQRLEIFTDYGLTGQPETFFIDQDGTVVSHVPGPLFEDDLYRLLDVLVARDG